jgi:hypothetical protein
MGESKVKYIEKVDQKISSLERSKFSRKYKYIKFYLNFILKLLTLQLGLF